MWPLTRKQPPRGLLLRALAPADYAQAIDLLRAELPLRLLTARVLTDLQTYPLRLKKTFFGVFDGVQLLALAQVGSTMSPALAPGLTPDKAQACMELLAKEMIARAHECTSVLGKQTEVEQLWPKLVGRWPHVREFRYRQPLLEALTPAAIPAHPEVRPAHLDELEPLFQAAVRMFKEEVGRDPTRHDGGRNYRHYVSLLQHGQRSYVISREGKIIFKADVGIVFEDIAQLHGIWVDPELRGQGIGARAVAAVTEQVRVNHASRVTLYVNDFNTAARRIYDRAGYREIGVLSTYLM